MPIVQLVLWRGCSSKPVLRSLELSLVAGLRIKYQLSEKARVKLTEPQLMTRLFLYPSYHHHLVPTKFESSSLSCSWKSTCSLLQFNDFTPITFKILSSWEGGTLREQSVQSNVKSSQAFSFQCLVWHKYSSARDKIPREPTVLQLCCTSKYHQRKEAKS